MAYGSTSTISYLGTMAAGAMADGLGFAPATDGITPLIQAAGNSTLAKTSSALAATNAVDDGTIQALCNRDINGSGAFVGTVPAVYTSTVGVGIGVDRLGAHTTLMFGANPTQMTQTFFAAEGLASNSEQLAPTLNKLNQGVNFGKFPTLDGLVYPADGVFPNFLGTGYPDMQSVVTNGVSTLVTEATIENFKLLASDLTNLGSAFNVEDIANFGNPGQVIGGISAVNGLTASGLDRVLAEVGIDPISIYSLGDPSLNTIMQSVLESITIPELISNTQTLLDTNIADMTSLGDYTNFDKIFVNSASIISFSTMAEFVEKVQAIELGRIDTLAELAEYIDSVEPATLPTIHNTTTFTRSDYIDSLIAKFLGGTGPNNSITLIDIIGSLGGAVIKDLADQYIAIMNRLHTAGELTALQTHLTQLASGLAGDFTTGSAPNLTLTDPDGVNIGPVANPHPSFQTNKIGQIEDDCAALMSRRNVNPDIQLAIDAWDAIFKKIFNEKEFQSRIDMGYDVRNNLSENALSFITGLRGNINEFQQGTVVRGMVDQAVANGDVGGEYVSSYIKELENKTVADNFDIRWRAEFDE